jgi:hypothetical protein
MQMQMLLKLKGRRILHVPLSQQAPSKTIAGAERLVFIVIYESVQLKYMISDVYNVTRTSLLHTVLHPRQDQLNSRKVSRTSVGRLTTKHMASMFFPVT